jgi:hypothetical protein
MYPTLLRAGLFSWLFLTFSFSPLPAQDGWQSLFDGKTLNGWRPNETEDTWKVVDGALVAGGERCHLFYEGEVANHNFKNFEFSAEVMTTPGSNSGIYFHTEFQDEGWPNKGYECQVINSNPEGGAFELPGYQENKMTGSIDAIRNTWISPVKDNEWFTYRILVSGKTIRTFINERPLCEHTEIPGSWRGKEMQGRWLDSGTFALQGHDPKSIVRYRNLKVRLLPEDAPTLVEPLKDRELDRLLTEFADHNVSLIDIGIAPEAINEQLLARARLYGITVPSDLPLSHLQIVPRTVVVFNDRHEAPSAELLQAAKAAKAKIAFSSGGASNLDPERIRKRLEAIQAADLEWKDIWIPGKNF